MGWLDDLQQYVSPSPVGPLSAENQRRIFGGAPEPKATPAKTSLTNADHMRIFGAAAPAERPRSGFVDFITDPAEWKKGGETLLRDATSAGEFLGAGIGMAVGSVAGGARSAEQQFKGVPRREALQAGAETAGRVGAAVNPMTFAKNLLGYEPDPSAIDKAMESISKGIHHYGEKVEVGTDRVLLAEDVDAFASALMGGMFGRSTIQAISKGAQKLGPPNSLAIPQPLGPIKDALATDLGGQSRGKSPVSAERASYADVTRAEIPEVPEQLGFPKRSGPESVDVTKKSQVKEIFDEAKKRGGLVVGEGDLADMFAGRRTPQQAVAESQARIAKTRMTEGTVLGEEVSGTEARPLLDVEGQPLRDASAPGFTRPAEALIAEHKAAQRAAASVVDAQGQPLNQGLDRFGRPDPRLLGALGVTAATWAAMDPEARDTLAAGGLIAATTLARGEGSTWKVLGEGTPYNWNLSRYIDPNQISYSKAELTQKLGKVPKEEAAVITTILAGAPEGARISAKDLLEGLMERTADWKLKTKETSEYASYGLEAIRRNSSRNERTSTTTLFLLPEHLQLSDANHFSNKRYFGHTRSFIEDGKVHVVELQSDLAQNVRPLKEGERPLVEAELAKVREEIIDVEARWKGKDRFWLFQETEQLQVRKQELSLKLRRDETAAKMRQVSPIIGLWPRRLIRETLAKEARRPAEIQRNIEALRDDLVQIQQMRDRGSYEKLHMTVEDFIARKMQVEQRIAAQQTLLATAGQSVRFATADTVAKVEGWELSEAFRDGTGSIKERFENPGHQSIYNRYDGEISRYLRGKGGVDYTDAQGHTWIEVPVAKGAERPDMFGKADPELLTGVAAAAGVAGYAYANREELGASPAILAALATALPKGSGFKLLDEARLLKAAGEGKQGAFTELYDRTKMQTQRSIASFERNGIDVEAVVQEAYLSAFKRLDPAHPNAFRGESKFSTYMHTVAKNKALNALEAQRSRPSTTEMTPELEQTAGHGETPATIAQQKALGTRLEEALGQIDPSFRRAFEAKEVEGLSYEEIAVREGVPIGTVRSRISRAKEQLQAQLKDYADQDAGQQATPGWGERGSVDKKLIATLGAISTGSVLGAAYADDPLKGAIVGGILGVGALSFKTLPVQKALMRGTTRLADIDPPLRRAIRDMEHTAAVQVNAASDVISSFIKPFKKLSSEQRAAIETAHKAADPAALAEAMKGNRDLVAAHAAVRKFLSGIEEQLVAFGRFKEGIPDYLPLMVKDYKGLMESMGKEVREGLELRLHKANTKSIMKEGRPLNEVEKTTIVNDYLLREPSTSYLPAFAKHRRLRMTPERQAFYHDLETTLIHYSHAAISDITRTTFFGQDLKTLKKGKQQFTNVEGSIGALTARAIDEGRWTPEQAVEVQGILRARFGGGESAPTPWLQDVRNVSGALLLGQIGSGLIQTSESLLAGYHHNIRPAVEGLAMTVLGKGIKPGEFGLANHVIEEVIGSRPTGKVLSGLLKVNLLATFDQMGIGTNLTASFIKNQALAKTEKGRAQIAEKWGPDYGPDMPRLLEELRTSSMHKRTPLIESLLWQEISDIRPASRSEAPELFNAHPNARLAYHLKQFMLTQSDILYRDGLKKIQTGEPRQIATGIKNLALYATALSLVAIPADAIKDWIAGRGLQLDKIDYVDNFIRNFGLSRYTLDSVRGGENPGGAVAKALGGAVTPPVVGVGYKLAEGLSEPKKLVPMVPLVGRAYSDRYLGGNERKEIAEARVLKRTTKERQQLSPEARLYLRNKRQERREAAK